MGLDKHTILEWVVRAANCITGIDKVVVATSENANDNPIVDWCTKAFVKCYRGPEEDVLDRFLGAAEGADTVVRLTADCPLLDPAVCSQVLRLLKTTDADYVGMANWPDGLDCEAFTFDALKAAAAEAKLESERSHVTPFIRNRRHRFQVRTLECPLPGLRKERWTLDDPQDLLFLREVVAYLPEHRPPWYAEVLEALDKHPGIRVFNAATERNEGYEPSMTEGSFEVSAEFLERAEAVIPLGSQTFSKSRLQYPVGHAPLFITHGEGGRVWDVDGNEYVDLVSALLPVTLGYGDPDVDAAIRAQLSDGISFSLASTLETELAERLVEVVPSAEMVRFGKNGSDATSAAIRLARAYTGRDHVAVMGYHGWHDWYIGATSRNKGVPDAVSDLTTMLPYDDLGAVCDYLKAHPSEVACLIMEPMNRRDPSLGYLAELKEMLRAEGTLFIFDEVITGFRYGLGGAQELFGVTPDLTTLGKGMGNGMPISAVVGRADVMAEMTEICFSGTFSGEALSLAASIATIDKMRREPVITELWQRGWSLAKQTRRLIRRHGLTSVIQLVGKAPWMLLEFADHPAARKEAIQTLFSVEMLRRGVLILGSHNICYAHNDADVAWILEAYDSTLARIAKELETGSLEAHLPCPAIQPSIRVR
tara:strand:- start:997 stop:2946 length:1950 start_codon:yes stop_codon:yes gene_type:complete